MVPVGTIRSHIARFFRRQALTPYLLGCLVIVASSVGAGSCETNQRVGDGVCLSCHTGVTASDKTEFAMSPHQGIACEDCHGPGYAHVRNGGRGGLFIINPENQSFDAQVAFCADCHEDISDTFRQTAHAQQQAVSCMDCHDVHTQNALRVASSTTRLDIPGYTALCGTCHAIETDQYLQSQHAVQNAVTCRGCHNVHVAGMLTADPINNALCLQCHASAELGFTSDAIVDAHTGPFHPVDPAGSGASRCVGCHLPPLQQAGQPDVPHDHTLFTIPPIESNIAADNGVFPVPPNSCAGIMGCHDASVPGSGIFHDVNNPAVNVQLQAVYDSTWGAK